MQDEELKEQNIMDFESESEDPYSVGSQSSGDELDSATYQSYLKKVFELKPLMEKVFEESKELNLFTYNKRHVRENRNTIIRARKKDFAEVMRNKVAGLLGTRVAEKVAKQLKGNDSLSTAQHSGSFNAQFVMHSGLQQALPYFRTEHPNLQNVIILACSLVSFNNYSNPRGLLFHTYKEGKAKLTEIAFFGRAIDPQPVIFHEAYNHSAVDEAVKEAAKLQGQGELSKDQASGLRQILDEIYGSEHALSAKTYHDQLTITNYYLFKKLFSTFPGKIPNLIFLSQEEIVLHLIRDFHINQSTTIHNILFDPKMHGLLEKYFNDVPGAFSTKDKKGTFLFWGVPKGSALRVQLWKKNGWLESEDGAFKVELKPDAIKNSIDKNELIPSYFLVFFVLAFYYGLFLMGAFKQTADLEKMLALYKKMLEEYGDTESLQGCDGLLSANLILPPSILYIQDPSGNYSTATAMDILINRNNKTPWEHIFKSYENITFSEVMVKMFPTIYNRSCPPEDKVKAFAKITEVDIDKLTGFPQKIPPIIRF